MKKRLIMPVILICALVVSIFTATAITASASTGGSDAPKKVELWDDLSGSTIFIDKEVIINAFEMTITIGSTNGYILELNNSAAPVITFKLLKDGNLIKTLFDLPAHESTAVTEYVLPADFGVVNTFLPNAPFFDFLTVTNATTTVRPLKIGDMLSGETLFLKNSSWHSSGNDGPYHYIYTDNFYRLGINEEGPHLFIEKNVTGLPAGEYTNRTTIWSPVENRTAYVLPADFGNITLIDANTWVLPKNFNDFFACAIDTANINDPDPIALASPVVKIKDGVASWAAVPNATGYTYIINDGAETATTKLSVELKAGDKIKVKAIGDGKSYTNSAFSAVAEYKKGFSGQIKDFFGTGKELVFKITGCVMAVVLVVGVVAGISYLSGKNKRRRKY